MTMQIYHVAAGISIHNRFNDSGKNKYQHGADNSLDSHGIFRSQQAGNVQEQNIAAMPDFPGRWLRLDGGWSVGEFIAEKI
ncbi:MAG: hypothetical protein R3F46_03890 [bacterium]